MTARALAAPLLLLGGCHAPGPSPKRPVSPIPPPVAAAAPATRPPPPPPSPEVALSPAQIAERATPSIALIRLPEGLGTGFVVAPEGKIATNLHVIRGAREATVVLADGREFKQVEVLAVDEDHDLAVLRIPLSGLPPLPLGDSNAVLPGERVVAIGHPLGLGNTVSDGLVSAVRVIDKDLTVLQISAPISPGSSGGPLFDEHGRVIGVSTLMSTRGQNLNFGMPVAYLKPLLASNKAVPLSAFAEVAEHAGAGAAGPALEGCTVGQLAVIVETLGKAIEVGAPLFNHGQPDACYRIYQGAALELDGKLEGCAGPRAALIDGIKRASALDDARARSFAMRDVFDGLLQAIERRAGFGPDGESPRAGRRRQIPVHPLSLLRGCSERALKDALDTIARAITVGAPLYNDGNREACFRIYEGAALELERKGDACEGVKRALMDGMRRADGLRSYDDKAWAMRDAFDGLVDVIERRLGR